MAHREIALPPRVRRIALRQAFGDRQARLVGRQRPWPVPLRHQHITNPVMAHREIALPPRVRRIALRQAFGDRQARLVGRQRPWPVPLRHQHITTAVEPPAFQARILGSLGLLNQRSEYSASLIEFPSADPGIAQLQRRIQILGIGLQCHLEVTQSLAEITPHQRQAGHIAGGIRFPAALAGR